MTNAHKSLTADQIFAMDDKDLEMVPVPEWNNGKIYMGVMSAADRDYWDKNFVGHMDETEEDARAWLVAKCAMDEDGKRIFSDEQISKLSTQKSSVVLDRLGLLAQKKNKLRLEDILAEVKNSGQDPIDGSPSDSPDI